MCCFRLSFFSVLEAASWRPLQLNSEYWVHCWLASLFFLSFSTHTNFRCPHPCSLTPTGLTVADTSTACKPCMWRFEKYMEAFCAKKRFFSIVWNFSRWMILLVWEAGGGRESWEFEGTFWLKSIQIVRKLYPISTLLKTSQNIHFDQKYPDN